MDKTKLCKVSPFKALMSTQTISTGVKSDKTLSEGC